MTRTNIDIDDELVAAVMKQNGLKTKREAVDFALRKAVRRVATVDELLALEGIGVRARPGRDQERGQQFVVGEARRAQGLNLVDSSVWVQFLRRTDSAARWELRRLLSERPVSVVTCAPVVMGLRLTHDDLARRKIERTLAGPAPARSRACRRLRVRRRHLPCGPPQWPPGPVDSRLPDCRDRPPHRR